ncbi:MAG: hypothetical protein WAO20_13470, partial [Acidobacteriota bacterium]
MEPIRTVAGRFVHARISQQTPTAAAERQASAALLLLVLLDVPSSTPAGAFVARLAATCLSTASLRTLVRNPAAMLRFSFLCDFSFTRGLEDKSTELEG